MTIFNLPAGSGNCRKRISPLLPPKEWAMISTLRIEKRIVKARDLYLYLEHNSPTPQGSGGSSLWPCAGKSSAISVALPASHP